MELRTLRYFDALARELHFTRAAEACNVSQSTLSHQIKHLEMELGCALFDRTRKRPTLTPAGQIFAAHSRAALAEVDLGIRSVKNLLAPPDDLRIGVWTRFLLTHVLPRCLALADKRGLAVPITIREMAGSEVLEALESNQIDLAIASEVPATRGYRLTSLFVEHLELAVPPGHPLAQRRSVRPIDLHCMRLALLTKNYVTRGVIDQYLADAGAVPIVAAELSSPETLTSFALRASLPIIGPKGALSDMADFLKVPLVSPVPGRPMVAIIREGMSMSNVAGEFVKLIQEVWESSQNESTEETPQ